VDNGSAVVSGTALICTATPKDSSVPALLASDRSQFSFLRASSRAPFFHFTFGQSHKKDECVIRFYNVLCGEHEGNP
jgi:hypothetical protein